MRFGCCGSMISPAADPIGIEVIDSLAEIGFDYIELSLRDLAALPETAFNELSRRVAGSGIGCEACNNFFPAPVRLTGTDANPGAALEYARKAMARAARLGADTVVFGSSAARNVPDGFPHDAAWRQLVELLRNLGALAEGCGMTIAIEPLTKLESNIINLASEGLLLGRAVDRPSVRLLVDYYHLTLEKEDPSVILQAGADVRHVHIAKVDGRVFPREKDGGLVRFFSCLRQIRYGGKCSVEAYTDDFRPDARRALRILKELEEGS